MYAPSSDPVAYAEFIRRHLLQPIAPDGSAGFAVAETEHAVDGDRWLWADDNAKILEFMALPALWQRYPGEVEQIFRFIGSLCEGPFIFRRAGHARLEQSWREGGAARFTHTFLNVECDLPSGVVSVGMRFHDGRSARNLILTGNYVQFTCDGERYGLDAEEVITAWDIDFRAPRLTLMHRSELRFEQAGRDRRLGQLTYRYLIDARSMFVDVEVELELDPGLTVADVVLTIGQDNLSHNENAVHYGTIFADMPGRPLMRMNAAEPNHVSMPAVAAAYWSMVQQDEMRGFALAVHSMPREPARLSSIEAVVREPRQLHYVVSHHSFPGRWTGGVLQAAERKIITSGGFYDRVAECSAMFRRHAAPGFGNGQPVDLSISYDYGAELAAFARVHRTLGRPGMPAAAMAMRDESLALFDRYYAVYAENLLAAHRTDLSTIFSRPLAFVALGLVDMWKATQAERYRSALREVIGVLLEFERPFIGLGGEEESGFLMGQRTNPWPYMDCHAAAVLALTRALPVLEDATLAPSIDRALSAYQLTTMPYEFGGVRKVDVVAVDYPNPDGGRFPCHGFWNFCAGLSLRSFKALRAASHPLLRQVVGLQRRRMEIMEGVLRLQLGRSLRDRDGALEILTSELSGEGNSETQPWVALGLIDDSGDD